MIILGIVGILCLMYYLACGLYAGFGVSYLWIWLAGGLLCLAGALFLYKKEALLGAWRIPVVIRVILIAAVVFGAALFVLVEANVIGHMFQKGDADLDYVIVLGAQVKKDRPSLALLYRIEVAGAYLKENPETIAILSGGQGPDEPRSEAECMAEGLIAMGIDKERLILEDQSTDTVENFQYSLEYIDDPDAKIGFVTSNFHVFRAGAIARKQMEQKMGEAAGEQVGQKTSETAGAPTDHEIYGISAPSHSLLQVHYMVREFLAILKDTLTGRMNW